MSQNNRAETFYVVGDGRISRGEALRALIAATYRAAKALSHFTTDDVFARVTDDGYDDRQFRLAVADSKLIAVALRKAAKKGLCAFPGGTAPGSDICHGRRKGVWISKIAAPTFTGPLTY